MKRIIAALLAAVVFACLPQVQGSAYAEKNGKTEEPASVDLEELDDGLQKLLKKNNVNPENISIAVEFTATGETYYHNADKWVYPASLSKLPVAMTFSHMLETGEIEERKNDKEALKKMLVNSNYAAYSSAAKRIYGKVETGEQREQDVAYSGFEEDGLPEDFYTNLQYSARFYLGIIRELYYNSEEYPDVLDYMKKASPFYCFREKLEGKYEIAQKYGSESKKDVVHAAGVIYTESPVLLVVMTTETTDAKGNRVIGSISEYIAAQASGSD